MRTSVFERCMEVVEEAGRLIAEGASAIRVVGGVSENPTTDLDRRVDAFLYNGLMEACAGLAGGVAYLSEERIDDPMRLRVPNVLIVDPIDGTRSLLSGIHEVAISIALWSCGTIIWGCVHNPFTLETWSAIKGGGTWRDGKRCEVSAVDNLTGARLIMSRHEHEKGELAWWLGALRYRPVGSIAYKMALVADGRADATMTRNLRHEWDIAAGALLVQEAGGKVSDKIGRELVFNAPNPSISGVVVSNGLLHEALLALVDNSVTSAG